jgi:hypothetical protein
MSEQQTSSDIITCRFTWQSLESACPKCAELNGMEWIQDINLPTLHDVFFGDVWDLDADCSLAHSNCKCALLVSVEFHPEEWTELTEFKTALEENLGMSVGTSDISGIREQIASLREDIETTNISMRQGEMTLIRFTYALERLGLPKDVRQVVTTLMRVIQTIRLVQISITMLEMAEGPIGWLMAGMSVAAAGMTGISAVKDVMGLGN